MATAAAATEIDDVISPVRRQALNFAAMAQLGEGEFTIDDSAIHFSRSIGKDTPASIPLKEIAFAIINTSNDDEVAGAINLTWRHLEYDGVHTDFLNFAFKRAAEDDFHSAKAAFHAHAAQSPMGVKDTQFPHLAFEVMNMPLLRR